MKPKKEASLGIVNTGQSVANPQPTPYDPEKFRDWLYDGLRLASAYWQTILPFVQGHDDLKFVEFGIALKASERLIETLDNARLWNQGQWPRGDGKDNGNDGKKFPISADEFPVPIDLSKVKVLPVKNRWLGVFMTFDEIIESNRMASGRLPLLPALQIKRKGRKENDTADVPLSLKQIRAEVEKFLKKFNDACDAPSPNAINEYKLAREDSLKNNHIELKHLCKIRWERFKEFGQTQRQRALKREANKRAKTLAAKRQTKKSAGNRR